MNSIDNRFICETLHITFSEGKYEITVSRKHTAVTLKVHEKSYDGIGDAET
jgi:hypothetical protein